MPVLHKVNSIFTRLIFCIKNNCEIVSFNGVTQFSKHKIYASFVNGMSILNYI